MLVSLLGICFHSSYTYLHHFIITMPIVSPLLYASRKTVWTVLLWDTSFLSPHEPFLNTQTQLTRRYDFAGLISRYHSRSTRIGFRPPALLQRPNRWWLNCDKKNKTRFAGCVRQPTGTQVGAFQTRRSPHYSDSKYNNKIMYMLEGSGLFFLYCLTLALLSIS